LLVVIVLLLIAGQISVQGKHSWVVLLVILGVIVWMVAGNRG
jgi:hypothetical protein